LKLLDSGFRRNDKKGRFLTFYDKIINVFRLPDLLASAVVGAIEIEVN